METCNGWSGIDETDFAIQVAEHLGMNGTGGSDAHAVLAVGICYTVFHEPVRTESDLIALLKQGRFHAVDPRWSGRSEARREYEVHG